MRFSRPATVIGAAAVLGITLSSVAVADDYVTSHDIKNQSIQSWDISADGVGSSEIRKDSIGWYGELNQYTRDKITSLAGQDGKDGEQGPKGEKGDKGEKGEPGDPATDVLGSSVVAETFNGNVASIGGSFADRATELGTFDLQAGTYLISSDGFFITNQATSGETRMQLAIRGVDGSKWGQDYGTCFTGLISQLQGREATCNTTRTITVESPMTVEVYGFGYADDQGSADSGKVDVAASTSVVKVG
jgi:hypothetical protein